MSGEGTGYVLGSDQAELERLTQQHATWVGQAQSLIERAGLSAGQTLLDLGCGPGLTTMQLARVVGRGGRVIARDASADFITHLELELKRLGIDHVVPSLGPVEELDLPESSLDGAFARWLFCWLPDAGALLSTVSRALRPGGAIVCQEYFDWGAMKLVPRSPAHDRVVDACMVSWRDAGATIDIGEQLPGLAAECGLRLEYAAPLARVGRPGSPVWSWISAFFDSYLPRLVAQGLLDEATRQICVEEWRQRLSRGIGFVAAPTMIDLVLRKP